MSLSLPWPTLGGKLPRDDDGKLIKELERRLQSIESNFDQLSNIFPLSPSLLQPGLATEKVSLSTLTLTQADQSVPDCSVTLPLAGQYLALATFEFRVTAVGVGFCFGALSTTGSPISGLATFGGGSLDSTGAWATIPLILSPAHRVKGEVISLTASKLNAGGTGLVEGGSRLVVLGPL